MLNQVYLVGRLQNNPKLENLDAGRKYCKVEISVPRSYKNEEGIFESDIMPIILWDGIATNTEEYCKKGDLVGVKGRVEVHNENIMIIVDNLTFLTSKKMTNNRK